MTQPIEIAVFTGTRAEYGLLYHTIQAIHQSPKTNLQLWVGGSHLSQQYGHTIDEIKADGFPIRLELPSEFVGQNTALDFSQAALGVSQYLREAEKLPDYLIVLGDRHESFAVASAAFFNRIAIAHIHGGDIVQGGMFDDPIRHALTKLSHVHFPATELSASRIQNMGEELWRICTVGAPGLENLKKLAPQSREALAKQYGLDASKPWVLLTQHPISLWPELAGLQMQQTLDALTTIDNEIEVIATFPNQDDGGSEMQAVLKEYASRFPNIKLNPSLGRIGYLSVMQHCLAVVGNSSSGLLETAFWGIPCINIGPRQNGRERGANVVDVEQNTADIGNTLKRLLNDPEFYNGFKQTQHPFGDGTTSEKILEFILNLGADWSKLLNKQLEFPKQPHVQCI